MSKIFISHANTDTESAKQWMKWLRERGFEHVFLDVDGEYGIPPGANWESTLYRHIVECVGVLLVLTPEWFSSCWCFAEYAQARALGKYIIPIIERREERSNRLWIWQWLLRTTRPGDEMFVSRDIQHLDLTKERERGLERLQRALETLIPDRRPAVPAGPAWVTEPYRGLLPYEEQHQGLFFGRDQEIRRLFERVNSARIQDSTKLVVLTGAPGCGKSSLLHAGLLPRLKEDRPTWIVLPTLHADSEPLDKFARIIAMTLGDMQDWRHWRDRIAHSSPHQAIAEIAELLRARSEAATATILITIEGMERILSSADAGDRQFLEIFSAALSSRAPFMALATLRPDYLPKLHAALGSAVPFDEVPLGTIEAGQIREVVKGSTSAAGLRLQYELTDQIVQDAAEIPPEDRLALLSFALRELYKVRGSGGELRLEDYQALVGGQSPIVNLIAARAESTMAEEQPSGAMLDALREVLVGGMVTLAEDGKYLPRPIRAVEVPSATRPLLGKLVASGLLAAGSDADTPFVEIPQEAILRRWPRLRKWLDEEREFFLGRDSIDQSAQGWLVAQGTEKTGSLLAGYPLERASYWLANRPGRFSAATKNYIQTSVDRKNAQDRKRNLLRRTFVVLAFVLGIAVGAAICRSLG
ncbi:MAG TPA: TIR domain-containing protein [Xanthobacteraceae bacterium]|nr:TIR domain-containing protein [Xanthobacteraceae bacterium]